MERISFEAFDLNPGLLRAVENLGFEKPTPIQSQAIPLVLERKDILGQAQTGTGKTAAFGLPLLHAITQGAGLQGLILCPTRELAIQVAEELAKLGQYLQIRSLPVYGGQSIEHQIRALKKKPEVVVATPGRLLDHLQRRTIRLDNISTLILDEADEMLDMGFLDDIKAILQQTPVDRQTLLFSATIPPEIRHLAETFMTHPQTVAIKEKEVTAPLIEQRYYEVNPRQKVEALCRILDVENPPVVLIFCRTKKGTDELAKALQIRGYSSEALHGDLSQRERDNVMVRFRKGVVEILVATDVAARGLDISHVTHVINFDIPQDSESYVHRIGRTGRAGREGVAITLVNPREVHQLHFIENHVRRKIKRHELPTLSEAIERREHKLSERVLSALGESAGKYKALAGRLLDENASIDLLTAALSIIDDEGRQLETSEFAPVSKGLKKIKVPIGKASGIRPKKIVSAIVNNSSLTPREVGDIRIFDDHTMIEVPGYAADTVSGIFKKPKISVRPGQRSKSRNAQNRLKRH